MEWKELIQHRVRDIDAVFRSNKKGPLGKYILERTICKLRKISERRIKCEIPSSQSQLNGFNFLSRKNTLDFLFYSKYYEPQTTKYLFRKRGTIFLDIGAHIGRFSILGSKNFNKVVAFEANPFNYSQLIKNVKINTVKNIIPLNLALSNIQGKVYLEMPKLNTGATKISKKGDIETKSVLLDEYLRKNKISPEKISLTLIDVEGHEEEVLKGAKEFLKKTNSELIIECFSPEKIKNELKKYGYKQIKIFDFYNYLFRKE